METKDNIKKAAHIRAKCAGLVGGANVAAKATDKQILDLVDLQDEHAELSNRATANRLQYTNLINSIKTS